MRLSLDLGLGSVVTMNPGVWVRTIPGAADTFYAVSKNAGGSAISFPFIRNSGGAASSSNIGVQWPETRMSGAAGLASFAASPVSPDVVYSDDIGAHDIVAANASGKFFGSFHGLGTDGSLVSETISMDGVEYDPYTDAKSGRTLSIRNVTIATDGTTTFERDLEWLIGAGGVVTLTVHDISLTGGSYVYAGMMIGSGAYDEFDVKVSGAWQPAPPMGANPGNAYIQPGAAIGGIRLRDTVTGRQARIEGGLAGLSGYVRSETERASGNDRLKAYFGRHTDASALIGATWTVAFDMAAAGSQFSETNLFTNGDFASGDLTGWTKASGTPDPAVVSGAMRHTRDGSTQRERQSAGFTVTTSDIMAYVADLAALSAGSSPFLRVANGTAMSATGAMVDQQFGTVGRNMHIFVPNVTTIYAGMQFNSGTVGQTCDTDNYGLYKLN